MFSRSCLHILHPYHHRLSPSFIELPHFGNHIYIAEATATAKGKLKTREFVLFG